MVAVAKMRDKQTGLIQFFERREQQKGHEQRLFDIRVSIVVFARLFDRRYR